MAKYQRLLSLVITSLFITLVYNCSSSSSDDSDSPIDNDVIPTNLELTVDIVGSDLSNPNGNGSGMVTVHVSATNAVRFGVKFENDNVIENSNGTFSKTFTQSGVNNYLISAFAYSSTNNSITTFETVTVFVDNGQPQLIWSDEFNTAGTLDESKWNHETGGHGWGNDELQYHTSLSQNSFIDNGSLKIKSIKENYMGAEYTSARITTQGKFEFSYGKVEIRAKLPQSQGTWPGLWMLGASYESVGWPTCGEIDIMEQTGWDKSTILATCHWSTSEDDYASYGLTTNVSDVTDYHIYSMEWTETYIKMFIDDVEYYVIDLNATLPFDQDFFLIFNVAMGGTLGGTIDSDFVTDIMEIDYVRVYQ